MTILVVGVVVGMAIVALLFLRHCRQRQHHDELVSPLEKLEAAQAHPLPHHHNHSKYDTTPPVEVHPPSHGAFDTDNPYEVLQAEARLGHPSSGQDPQAAVPRTASKLDKQHLPHGHGHGHEHGSRDHDATHPHPQPSKPHREESRSHIGHRYDPDVERVQDEIVTTYNLEETAALQAHYHQQRQSISSAVTDSPRGPGTATGAATGAAAVGAHHVARGSVDATPVVHAAH